MTTRNVNQSMKKRVAAEQKWKCKHCFKILDETYQIDHIIPLELHGSNERWNLQALCPNCHARKTYIEQSRHDDKPKNLRVCLQCNTIYSPYFNHVCLSKKY
jgi:5-methylcytosine-specific restriction endonuclease McrA